MLNGTNVHRLVKAHLEQILVKSFVITSTSQTCCCDVEDCKLMRVTLFKVRVFLHFSTQVTLQSDVKFTILEYYELSKDDTVVKVLTSQNRIYLAVS